MADYFIKVSNGMPEHPKTADLSDRAFRVIVEMWCVCSRAKTDGHLKRAQFPRKTTAKVIEELQSAGLLIAYGTGASLRVEIHDYLGHQNSKDNMADLHEKRVKAGSAGGRAKANGLASARANGQQMPSKTSSKRVAEVEVEVDRDKEQLQKLPSVASRATRLPADWQPSPELVAWVKAECPNVDGRTATENFRDWWHSKAGKDAAKVDWAAAYRGWMRRENERRPPPGQAGRPGNPNPPHAPLSTGTQRAMAAVEAARQVSESRNHHLQIGAS